MVREKKVYESSNASTTSEGDISGRASEAPVVKRRASRAGTRCVSTLSSDQLSRKRANDREAQRAIRKRAKDHIESLERRIQELTCADGGDAAALVDAQERNRELERELKELRERVRQMDSPSHSYGEWASDVETGGASSSSSVFNGPDPYNSGSSTDRGGVYQSSHTRVSRLVRPAVTSAGSNGQIFKIEPQSTGPIEEIYSVGLPLHKGWIEAETPSSVTYNIEPPFTTSMPAFLPLDHQSSALTWQPSLRSWELPIRYLPPTGAVDSMLLNILQEQRCRTPVGTVQGTRLISPANMRGLLYCKQGTMNLSDPVSNAIAEILHGTQMQSLPEKAACLLVMHRLLCWQISPLLETYEKIPEWFSPRPSQLVEAHALWVSQIPWPKLRDKVIRSQHQYATEEFQELYTISLSVNWPYQDVDILMFEHGEVRATPIFESHVTKLENWSLNAPFSTRYPELGEFCKFGSVGF